MKLSICLWFQTISKSCAEGLFSKWRRHQAIRMTVSNLFWSKPAWTLPLRIKVGVKKCKLRRENILHLIMHYISTIRSLSFSSIIPIAIIPNSNPWDLRSDLRWTIRDWNSPSGWIISYHFGHSCICVLWSSYQIDPTSTSLKHCSIRADSHPPRLSIISWFIVQPSWAPNTLFGTNRYSPY